MNKKLYRFVIECLEYQKDTDNPYINRRFVIAYDEEQAKRMLDEWFKNTDTPGGRRNNRIENLGLSRRITVPRIIHD